MRIGKPKIRKVFADGIIPAQSAVIHQNAKGRGGERFGGGSDGEEDLQTREEKEMACLSRLSLIPLALGLADGLRGPRRRT